MAAFFVQSASATALTTPVSATLSSTPKVGNLLVASVTANVTAANISISGFTSAVSVALAAGIWANEVFYKICDGTDTTSISAVGTLATVMQLHVFEFSGFNIANASVLDKTATTADSGLTVTSRASGTTASTTTTDQLAFASIGMSSTNGGSLSWTNSFATGLTTTDLATAYLITTATGAQSTTASWSTLALSAGCITTFIASVGNSYYRGGGR